MRPVRRGNSLDVLITEEGIESQEQAFSHVPPNQKACIAQLFKRLDKLAAKGRLRTPDEFTNEGPKIYAVKARCGLRAYGWFSSDKSGKKIYVIGHVVLKKSRKANPADLERTRKLREHYEGN